MRTPVSSGSTSGIPGSASSATSRAIDPTIVLRLQREDLIPVIATVGVDDEGQAYNVNADTVAGAIAESLTAEKLVYLTDVAGVYGDWPDEASLISRIDVEGLERLVAGGKASEGMIPKLESCRGRAPARGAARAHPRRAAAARALVGVLHPGGCRHDGPPMTHEPVTQQEVLPLAAAQALDAEHVMQTYGRLPVSFVRGDGTLLFDSDGRRYLDFLSGLAVTSLGHAHPEVAAAIADQAQTLLHVSNLYYNDLQPRLAARLDARLGGDGRVFFANSGAEANECAIKLARRYGQRNGGPERYHVISAYGSFHGRTLTTLAATGQPQKQETFQPLPTGFRQVQFEDIDALANALDDRVAAVMLEPVQGEGGVNPAAPEYLQAVRRLCDEREALLILDEVQTGLGRTGRWFGFEHSGIRPDIVTMAKALGNGVPIGACWARADVAAAFAPGDHATTFGGQPFAARAALAVLDVMEREQVPSRADRAGVRLCESLQKVPGVVAVRGLGLLLAAELAPGIDAKDVAQRCMEAGLIVNAVTGSALRLAPPLLVSDAEIDEAVAVLANVLKATKGES